VVVRRARLAREDDRIVRRGVAEAAVLDEIDAAEIAAPDVALAGIVARQRGWTEERSEKSRDAGRDDHDQCSHVKDLPWTSAAFKSASEALRFPERFVTSA
jgi:hypothetical protein